MKTKTISTRLLLAVLLIVGLLGNIYAQSCLTSNGDFSGGLSGWGGWRASEEGATADFNVVDGVMEITNISTSGIVQWAALTATSGFALETGQTYEVSFDARSTSSRTITVGPRNTTDYSTYTVREIILGPTMETHTFKYTHLDAADSYAQMMFYVGESNAPIYIDNYCIKESTIEPNGVSLNILPIGNSISQGLQYNAGTYRKMLFYELTGLGYDINMVGSKQAYASPTGTSPFGGAPDPDETGWDQDHECYWGWTTTQVFNEMSKPEVQATFEGSNAPDVVTLHLGTNNLGSGPAALKDIIDLVRTKNPNVTIFCARLINSQNGGFQSSISNYNADLDALAPGWSTPESPVILVNQYASLDVNNDGDWADALHPSKGGGAKMAKAWLAAIEEEFAPDPIPLTNIGISPSSVSPLTVGQAVDLDPVFTPLDATNKDVTWSSDNLLVATVNASTGRVSAVGQGTATITVTTAVTAFDPAPYSASVLISVNPPVVDTNPIVFASSPAHFATPRALPITSLGGVIEVPVSNHGGFPNDGLDDRVAIQAAIDYAKTVAPARVVFQPGTYDIKTFNPGGSTPWALARHSIFITGASNIELDGNNTEILIHNPTRGFLRILSSDNIIVKDLTVDYAILPYTQGKVIARDNGSVTVKIDNGFPLPTESHFSGVNDYGIAVYNWSMLKDSTGTGALKPGAPNLYEDMGFTDLGDSTFQFNVAPGSWHSQSTDVGDYWVYQARYNESGIFDCVLGRNITYLNNTIYSSPAGAFSGADNWELNILRCNVDIRPGSGRVNSTDADIVHLNGGHVGPWVQECNFSGFADDAVNIKHSVRAIFGASGDQITVLYDVEVGETLEIYNPGSGNYIGEFTIEELVSQAGNDFTVRLNEAPNFAGAPVCTNEADKYGLRAYLTSRANKGFIFRDNEFRNHRGWGIIVQAKEGEIKGNTFQGSSSGGVKFDNIANWTEGFLAADVVVDGNTFDCTATDNSSVQYDDHGAIVAIITKTATSGCNPEGTFCPAETIQTFQGLKNITIKNNNITYFKTGVQIANVNGLTYSGNTFSTCSSPSLNAVTPEQEIFANNTFVGGGLFGISVAPAEVRIVDAQVVETLTATLTPSDASGVTITWESDNEAVATVDQSGNVTAVSDGIANIIAYTDNREFEDASVVTVELGGIVDDIVSVSGPDVQTAGDEVTVAVEYAAYEARDIWVVFQLDSNPFTWYGSTVTTVAAGTGTVNVAVQTDLNAPAGIDAYQYSAFITPVGGVWENRIDDLLQIDVDLLNEPTSISLPSATTVEIGTTTQLNATMTPDVPVNITWTSADDAVATVDANGLVTGVSIGQVLITGTLLEDGGRSASTMVTVQEPTNCLSFNGDLSDGNNGWSGWAWTDGGKSADFAVVNGEFAVTNINATAGFDWVSVVNAPVTLEQGKSYVISFDARSTTERVITVGPRMGSGSFTTYAQREKLIDATMKTHTIAYTHTAATDNVAQMIFFLGATDDPVYIDNLCVVEGTITKDKPSLKILPIGNSITQANIYGSGTYRKMLYYELSNMGYTIDMVGSMNALAGTAPFNGGPDPNDTQWDQNHEAYWGYTTSQVLGQLNSNINSFAAPDILTIHLGTNNLTDTNAPNDIKSIITLLRGKNPNVTVFLAQLITAKTTHDNFIPAYNTKMVTVASEMNTAQSPVILVNQYTTLSKTIDGDWADALHPSRSGAAKMAKVWVEAIEALTIVTPPQVTYGLTVNSGSGSGSYQSGTVVSVTANAAQSGFQFSNWTVTSGPATIANANAANTTVTTGSSASVITANYTEVVPVTETLTALSGPATVTAGSTISVSVNYTAAAGRDIVFALQETVNYTAVGTDIVTVSAGSGTATASLAISGSAASASNYRYVAYMIPVGGDYIDNVAEITLDNITVGTVTNPTYALTVANGSGDGNYEDGTVVPIVADAPVAGFEFSGWTVSGPAIISDANAASTSVTTGAAASTVTANYAEIANPLTDGLTNMNGPSIVDAGTSISVSIDYEAEDAREIVISLQETTNFTAIGSAVVSVSAGIGTTTATFAIDAAAAAGTDYRYAAYMVPVGGAYPDRVAELSVNNITVNALVVNTDGLTNLNGPATVGAGTSINVTVDYEAEDAREIVFALQETTNFTAVGGTVVSVSVGNGTATATLAIDAAAAAGTDYRYAVYMVPVGGDYADRVAEISLDNITVTAPVDEITSIAGPEVVIQGSTANVSVTYEASTDRQIRVALQKASSPYNWYGTTLLTVGSGAATIDVPVVTDSSAPLGIDEYRYLVYITTVGGGWPARFNSVLQNNVDITSGINVYALTVNSGSGDGDYEDGSSVIVTADAPAAGQEFAGWNIVSGPVTLANANAASTTATTGASASQITATYSDILYTLTVVNGTGDGSYSNGSSVAIVADAAPAGQVFDGWNVSGPVTLANASAASTTVTTGIGAATVTATYVNLPPSTYTLTVNSGSGDGDYEDGSSVTVTADAPAVGQEFAGWNIVSGSVTLANASAASTTATTGASASEITATYSDILYTLTVVNGTGDGSYANGSSVAIVADAAPAGQVFDGWDVSGPATLANASAASTTATTGIGAATVTATYVNLPPSTYTLTVNSGSGDGDYEDGSSVTVTADAPAAGQEFAGWNIVSGSVTLANASTASTTATTGASASEITATYSDILYTLTVVNGTGDGSYANGSSVAIVADVAPAGQVFDGWNVSGPATLADASAASTTATIGIGAATVTATYVDEPTGNPTNLALNRPVTFSATTSNTQLVDGNRGALSYWKVPSVSGSAVVDLGAVYTLTSMDVYTHAYYQGLRYTIEVSSDGSTYTTVVNRSTNTTLAASFIDPVSVTARYVRMTVPTKAYGNGYSFVYVPELEVYGYSSGGARKATEFTAIDNSSVINVFPNPVTGDFLNVNWESGSGVQLMEIYDVTGKLMFVQQELNNTEITVDVSAFKKGVYLLKMKRGEILDTRKFIIK